MSENASQRDLLRLSMVCAPLRDGYNGKHPDYRKLQLDAASALVPTTVINGLRYVKPEDVPVIAEHYGLTPKASASATREPVAA